MIDNSMGKAKKQAPKQLGKRDYWPRGRTKQPLQQTISDCNLVVGNRTGEVKKPPPKKGFIIEQLPS